VVISTILLIESKDIKNSFLKERHVGVIEVIARKIHHSSNISSSWVMFDGYSHINLSSTVPYKNFKRT
jgi:hypothetical protein